MHPCSSAGDTLMCLAPSATSERPSAGAIVSRGVQTGGTGMRAAPVRSTPDPFSAAETAVTSCRCMPITSPALGEQWQLPSRSAEYVVSSLSLPLSKQLPIRLSIRDAI
eukprot:scaffold161752_cov32-Tisochrysis_lutea.AAC.6